MLDLLPRSLKRRIGTALILVGAILFLLFGYTFVQLFAFGIYAASAGPVQIHHLNLVGLAVAAALLTMAPLAIGWRLLRKSQ